MSAGQVKIPTGVKTLAGGMCCINGVAHNLTGGAVRIGNEVKHFSFGPPKHKVRIVRSYDGNATSYCRMIVNGTTTNDTKEVEFDAGTTIEWFVMSIGAMAPQAKIILNGTTVQAGPGAYKMPLNSDLLVQFARGGSGKKLYYEIYITEVSDTIKEVWLMYNKYIQLGSNGVQFFYPVYSYDQCYEGGMNGVDDSSNRLFYSPSTSNPDLDVYVYGVNGTAEWVSQGYRLVGLTESYQLDRRPDWWPYNAAPYFYTGETWLLNPLVDPTSFNAVVSFDIDFVSNGIAFNGIEFQDNKGGSLNYTGRAVGSVYMGNGTSGSWMGDFGNDTTAFRTITFLESPTGDLLAWLNANGVKQT